MSFYAGIGSRDLPHDFVEVLRLLGFKLAKMGYKLRSGGARGADDAFEKGCIEAGGEKEIYLPWKGFENKPFNEQGYFVSREFNYDLYKKAKALAQKFHPAWDNLPHGAKKMHTRNVHQVLGMDCETPSLFVACWTPSPEFGGTSQALRIAKAHDIPIFNFAVDGDAEKLAAFLRSIAA